MEKIVASNCFFFILFMIFVGIYVCIGVYVAGIHTYICHCYICTFCVCAHIYLAKYMGKKERTMGQVEKQKYLIPSIVMHSSI